MSVTFLISPLLKYKYSLLFYAIIIFIVYLNRKRFDIHGKIVALYRTKVGLKLMDKIGRKHTSLVKFLGSMGIWAGFLGMIAVFIFILVTTILLINKTPGIGGAAPVIPGFPIAGTGIQFPLITGWIALFVIIVVHEFSHGVVARAYNLEVKNSGIAFFGPILGAFVEPDEKKMAKESGKVQLSIFAAGPFSNILLFLIINFVIFLLVLNPAVNAFVDKTGVFVVVDDDTLPAGKSGITNMTKIIEIQGQETMSRKDFVKVMDTIGPGEEITLKSENKTFTLITAQHPKEEDKGFLGVGVVGDDIKLKSDDPFTKTIFKILLWISDLLGWAAFLSINIGLINLLPIFITDGARMLKVAVDKFVKDKNKSMRIWISLNWISVGALLILIFLPLFRWITESVTGLII
tara:strand:+ start:180 stop:1394 length:1215 start_codon:yes stop_codon:yes gene_type:complete